MDKLYPRLKCGMILAAAVVGALDKMQRVDPFSLNIQKKADDFKKQPAVDGFQSPNGGAQP